MDLVPSDKTRGLKTPVWDIYKKTVNEAEGKEVCTYTKTAKITDSPVIDSILCVWYCRLDYVASHRGISHLVSRSVPVSTPEVFTMWIPMSATKKCNRNVFLPIRPAQLDLTTLSHMVNCVSLTAVASRTVWSNFGWDHPCWFQVFVCQTCWLQLSYC